MQPSPQEARPKHYPPSDNRRYTGASTALTVLPVRTAGGSATVEKVVPNAVGVITHSSLWNLLHHPSPPKQPRPNRQDSNLLGILSRKKMGTVCPTLSLQLKIGETKVEVIALLDPCKVRSSILEKAVACLKLGCLNLAAIFHSLTTEVRLEHLLLVETAGKSPTEVIPEHIKRHFRLDY